MEDGPVRDCHMAPFRDQRECTQFRDTIADFDFDLTASGNLDRGIEYENSCSGIMDATVRSKSVIGLSIQAVVRILEGFWFIANHSGEGQWMGFTLGRLQGCLHVGQNESPFRVCFCLLGVSRCDRQTDRCETLNLGFERNGKRDFGIRRNGVHGVVLGASFSYFHFDPGCLVGCCLHLIHHAPIGILGIQKSGFTFPD